MSMDDLDQAIALIRCHEDQCDFSGPEDEHLIRKAEHALGLTFPPTYRRFLSTLGVGGLFGLEIYGIINDNFENATIPNGIWLTLNHRKKWANPESLILIADNGVGGYYAIDTAQKNQSDESPVIDWFSEYARPPSSFPMIAEDFGAFFRSEVETRLRDHDLI